MERYKARDIHFTGVRTMSNWQLKTYRIMYDNKSFSEDLEKESMQLLQTELPGNTDDNYGVGFMITHHGKGLNFVLLDWWCNENELQQQVYYSSKEAPEKLSKRNGNSPIACVWDLIVFNHERNAWVKYMMTEKPNKTKYLKSYIHGIF